MWTWDTYACKQMTFKRRDPMRTKIIIDNRIIEKVNVFNYLRNTISYEGEFDIDNKLNNFCLNYRYFKYCVGTKKPLRKQE